MPMFPRLVRRGGWVGGEDFLSHWWRQLIPGVCVPTNKYSPLLHLLWWALWCWIVRFFVSLSLCKTSVAIEWMWRHTRFICCRHTRRYRTFSSSAIALVLGCGILRNFAVCFWDVHILHFTLEFVFAWCVVFLYTRQTVVAKISELKMTSCL